MIRPLSSRKSWQSNNAGCTSKNFNGLVFDIFKLVHFHLLWHSKGRVPKPCQKCLLVFVQNFIFLLPCFNPWIFILHSLWTCLYHFCCPSYFVDSQPLGHWLTSTKVEESRNSKSERASNGLEVIALKEAETPVFFFTEGSMRRL